MIKNFIIFLICSIFLCVVVCLNKYYINKNNFIYINGLKDGIKIGTTTTLRYLYIDDYIGDTIYIDTILYNDIKNYYIKSFKY